MENLLDIQDLHAVAGEKEILKGLNLKINKGETHVIMGPNGAGKSTTANVILNNPEYKKVSGKVVFEGEDISNLSTDKIAKKGVFMSFQSPVEIPGISTTNFLKYAKNKITDKPVKIFELRDQIQKYMEELNMNPKLIERNLNVGFSGGEKKKNEILQMLVLEPKLVILDETDSGLDVDAVRTVSKGIEMYKNEENAVLIITHNTRILENLKVDYVHILVDGKIVKTVSKEYGVNYLNSNWAEQNPEEWWSAVCHGLKDILDENIKEELKSISFSGQMHGLVVLDEEDKVIRPAIIWCDQRTEKECIELNSLPWLGKVTGNQALTGFTAPKILWLKNNEYENFQKIKKIMLPKDYIAYKLSKIHGIDV